MGVADTSFPLYEKQWLNGLLGVLAFGGIQGACDFLFSTQGYGFLFYPAFLAFLFLCVAKGSTPEKGQESVLALFNAVLFLVFCAEYEVLTFSYPLWIFLSCGVFAFILAGRILVYTLDARLLWHYYVGLSFVSGYATAQAFKGESYEVSCLGILCFFLGFGLLTRFSKGLVLVLVLLGVGWKGFPERKNGVEHPTRPHVLLITVDTLRTDALSCYGGQNPTRFLDRLAQESVLYEQAYSTASWTLPSVLSIHTGLYPSANGVGIETSSVDIPPLSHEARPLALVLNQAGYRTIGMVSNYWFTKGRKLDIGFEVYRNFPYDYSPVLDKNPFYLRLLYLFLPPKSETSAVQLLKEAEQELKKGKGNYFLWIHLIEPHLPYGRDIDFSKYPESRGNLEDLDGIEVDQGDLRKGVLKLTPPAKKFLRWWYDQEVLRVDRLLEEFLGNLRQEGYLDNTMVLFASDHGEEFWDHGGVVHGHSLYNELLHVPLMIHYPQKLSPQRVSKRVSLVQIYPTLLKWLGIQEKIPKDQEWRTSSLFEEELPYLFAESLLYFEDKKALLTQTGKKWIQATFEEQSEIFHLLEDPQEKRPLEQAPHLLWKQNLEQWKKKNVEINEILEKTRTKNEQLKEDRKVLDSIGY